MSNVYRIDLYDKNSYILKKKIIIDFVLQKYGVFSIIKMYSNTTHTVSKIML